MVDLLAPGRTRAWVANLRAAEIAPPRRRLPIGGPSYHHMMMLYESLAALGGRRFSIQGVGVERLDEAIGRGRGLLLVTVHVGNWNLGAQFVAARTRRPVHSVAGIQLVRGWTYPLRLALRRVGIRIHGRDGAVARFTRILRGGGIVALHLDGDQHSGPGPATRGVALLARRTGAAILPAICLRERPGRLTVAFCAAPSGGPATVSPECLERVLLSLVREHPEQWTLFRPLWGNA